MIFHHWQDMEVMALRMIWYYRREERSSFCASLNPRSFVEEIMPHVTHLFILHANYTHLHGWCDKRLRWCDIKTPDWTQFHQEHQPGFCSVCVHGLVVKWTRSAAWTHAILCSCVKGQGLTRHSGLVRVSQMVIFYLDTWREILFSPASARRSESKISSIAALLGLLGEN